MQVLQEEKIDYIVAPYEADAQLAYLAINGLVDAVITEVSACLEVLSSLICMTFQHRRAFICIPGSRGLFPVTHF